MTNQRRSGHKSGAYATNLHDHDGHDPKPSQWCHFAWYESTDIQCWADPYPVGSRNIAWELNLTVTGCWRKAAFKFKYPKKPTHSRASAHSVATTAPNWCWWCSWKTWSNMPRASYSRPSLFIFIALKLDLELFARGKKGRIKWRSISLSLQHFQMLSSVSAVRLRLQLS